MLLGIWKFTEFLVQKLDYRYLMYICISQGLPITSYYKLIDWWLLVLFNSLALTLVFHTYLAYVIAKTRGVRKDGIMNKAKHLNTFANLAFIILSAIFNFVFWSIALMEHFKPAEHYLGGH